MIAMAHGTSIQSLNWKNQAVFFIASSPFYRWTLLWNPHGSMNAAVSIFNEVKRAVFQIWN